MAVGILRWPLQPAPAASKRPRAGGALNPAPDRSRDRPRGLASSVVAYGLATASTGLVGLAVVPVYTRALGPSGYGVVETITTLLTLATGALILGLDSGIAVLMPDQRTDAERARLVATAYAIVLLCAMAGAALFVIAGLTVGPGLLGPGPGALLPIAAVVCALTLVENIGLACLRNLARSGAYLTATLASGLGVLAIGLPLVAGGAGPAGAVAGMAGGAALGAVTAAAMLRRHVPGPVDGDRARALLRVGAPLLPASIAAWVVSVSDRLLLLRLDNLAEVGLYGAAARVALVPNLAISAFMLGWLPFALRIQRAAGAARLYAAGLSLFVAAGAIVTLLSVPLGEGVLRLVSGASFAPAGRVIWLLVAGAVAYGAYAMLNVGVMIVRRTAIIGLVTAAAAIVNVAANLVLIPRLGYLGAGIATLAAYLVSAAALYAVGQRLMHVPYELRYLVTIVVLTLVAATVAAMAGDDRLRWIIVLGVSLIIAAGTWPRLRGFPQLLRMAAADEP